MQTFEGFPREAFEFFMMLEINNTKPFFEAHREEFNEYILTPLKALSNDLAPAMLAKDPQIDARPVMGGTISRIYRDTRYKRDKRPLRTHMWMEFRRRDETHNRVGMFFQFSANSASSGMETWLYPAANVRKMQQHVMANGARYERIIKKIKQAGFVLNGMPYTRPNYSSETAAVNELLGYKQFWLELPLTLQQIMQPEFKAALQEHFLSLFPLYELLRESL
ncbi:DUF2461 domain-containing protein [Eubacteriales bacterium OttesenSCG-928-N14]|nr:DUF2461 domain-containing protein [Eubacteriales bacterium OttesenSCG-928-N14]